MCCTPLRAHLLRCNSGGRCSVANWGGGNGDVITQSVNMAISHAQAWMRRKHHLLESLTKVRCTSIAATQNVPQARVHHPIQKMLVTRRALANTEGTVLAYGIQQWSCSVCYGFISHPTSQLWMAFPRHISRSWCGPPCPTLTFSAAGRVRIVAAESSAKARV